MWKRGNVSSVEIGIRFGMTQSQLLFSRCFVGYVWFSAYWEWNRRSEAKWCQNAIWSSDVTRQLSCSGLSPKHQEWVVYKGIFLVHLLLQSAAQFSKIKWPVRTSVKILPYPSKQGNAVILAQTDCQRKSDSGGVGLMPHCPKHCDGFHRCYETFHFALD